MKTLLILLILTLSCSLHLSSAGPIALDALFEESCCENLTKVEIPLRRVRQVKENPTDCSLQALIVTTVCETRFCVDPNTKWAKKLKKDWKPTNNRMSKSNCPK